MDGRRYAPKKWTVNITSYATRNLACILIFNETLSNDTKVDELVTLTVTFISEICNIC